MAIVTMIDDSLCNFHYLHCNYANKAEINVNQLIS